MKALVNRFANDETGATAIEYGLIAALLSVAIIGALTALGGELTTTYGKVKTKMAAANATVK